LKPIRKIIVTNRDHDREAEQFYQRYQAPIVTGVNEAGGFASLKVDETVKDGDVLPGGLRVIDLPGKSPGEIGLYFDPALDFEVLLLCDGHSILKDAHQKLEQFLATQV